MASAATAAPPRAQRSFAGLLEEYAAPQTKFPPARDLDGLEDDVATLTYEHALKAQARYRHDAAPAPLAEDPSADSLPYPLKPQQEPPAAVAVPSNAAARTEPSPRKSASVTLRLTADEDGRLRIRAAEAGLTVSAYIRSCAFEVESLRAQVKQVVAQMRKGEQSSAAPRRHWLRRFLRRLLHRG